MYVEIFFKNEENESYLGSIVEYLYIAELSMKKLQTKFVLIKNNRLNIRDKYFSRINIKDNMSLLKN